MSRQVRLILAAAAPVAAGAYVAKRLFATPPVSDLIPGFINRCGLPKDATARDFQCIAATFIRAIVGHPFARLSSFGLMITWLPILFFWFDQSIKPGRPIVFHPLVTILLALIGQFVGIGIVATLLMVPLYALVKLSAPAGSPSPNPAPHGDKAFTSLSRSLHTAVLFISAAPLVLPEKSSFLTVFSYIFQAHPLIFLPLAFYGRHSAPAGRDPTTPNTYEALSSSFMPIWSLNLGSLAYLWIVTDARPDAPIVQFFLWDAFGALAGACGLYLVDLAAGEANGLPIAPVEAFFLGPPSAFLRYWGEKEKQATAAAAKKAK